MEYNHKLSLQQNGFKQSGTSLPLLWSWYYLFYAIRASKTDVILGWHKTEITEKVASKASTDLNG